MGLCLSHFPLLTHLCSKFISGFFLLTTHIADIVAFYEQKLELIILLCHFFDTPYCLFFKIYSMFLSHGLYHHLSQFFFPCESDILFMDLSTYINKKLIFTHTQENLNPFLKIMKIFYIGLWYIEKELVLTKIFDISNLLSPC